MNWWNTFIRTAKTTREARIHLLALDVDGTLLTSEHAISATSHTAIQALSGRADNVEE